LKKFADTPDSFNQISTSYVVIKKEFDKLKESKRTLENEKRSYRKKAESSAREAYESKEQLKILTNDLKQLDSLNKSLMQKVDKLEKCAVSQNPTSRVIANKRLSCESPEPKDKKRQCTSDIGEGVSEEVTEESFALFDDVHSEDAIAEIVMTIYKI